MLLAAQTTRAELVVTLEALYDVLLKIDVEELDRRYVDFEALAKRLEECIDKVGELPASG